LHVQYAAKGATLNLSDLVKDLKPEDVSDFVDAQWKGMVIPTTSFRYGMPTYVNMFVLYYNKNLFQKQGVPEPTPDWTHDVYADSLKKLTFMNGETPVYGGFARVDIPDRQYHARV
jgi:multiple sugar transport system substrate-binding protein